MMSQALLVLPTTTPNDPAPPIPPPWPAGKGLNPWGAEASPQRLVAVRVTQGQNEEAGEEPIEVSPYE